MEGTGNLILSLRAGDQLHLGSVVVRIVNIDADPRAPRVHLSITGLEERSARLIKTTGLEFPTQRDSEDPSVSLAIGEILAVMEARIRLLDLNLSLDRPRLKLAIMAPRSIVIWHEDGQRRRAGNAGSGTG
jgi:hypothetical protein